MTHYYQGTNQQHASFWKSFNSLPKSQHFKAFTDFYFSIKQSVDNNQITIQDAGRALEPGYFDDELQQEPHGGDITIACNLASELANDFFDNDKEKNDAWTQITAIMKKYEK